MRLSFFTVPLSGLSCFPGGCSFFRCREINPGTASFGKADRNRLLGGSGPMFPFADMVDFLADKLPGLGTGRFPRTLGSLSPFHGLFFWHDGILFCRWE